jgi:hypothetical protein
MTSNASAVIFSGRVGLGIFPRDSALVKNDLTLCRSENSQPKMIMCDAAHIAMLQ